MKSFIKPIVLFLLLSVSAAQASETATFDEQRPDGVSDKKWSSLKAAVQEAKLLPEPAGIGGQHTNFGQRVAVDGDWAMVSSRLPNYPVWVYQNIGGNWTKVDEIANSNDQSIRSMDIHNNYAAIAKGSQILIYQLESGSWGLSQTLSQFGNSLALDDSFLVAGTGSMARVYENLAGATGFIFKI